MKFSNKAYSRGETILNNTQAIILESKASFKDEGFIVLAVVPQNSEYVTWYMNEEGQTFHGHYTLDLEDAIKDFKERS